MSENNAQEQNQQVTSQQTSTSEYRPLRSTFGEACLWVYDVYNQALDLVGLGPASKAKRTEEQAKENFDSGHLNGV